MTPPVVPLPARLALIVLLAGGFAPKGIEGKAAAGAAEEPASPPPNLRTYDWPFQPTHMRVHPLTRIRTSSNERTGEQETYIDLQLDLLDQFGHTTKGIGEVRFELFSASEEERSERLEVWRIDINDLAANTEHYDWVTRMYRFNLLLPQARLAQHRRFRVQAFMELPGGTRLQTEALLAGWGEGGGD